MTRELLDSFWRAAAYCLHPKVIALSLLPLLIVGGAAAALGYWFWEPAVADMRAWLENNALLEPLFAWLRAVGAGGWASVLAPLVVVALAVPRGDRAGAAPVRGLRIEILDVGQGDAILLEPSGAPAVLVDGGPPGDDLASKLEDAGVDGLGAAVITHDQSDHAAGVEELLGRFPVGRLVYGRLHRRTLAEATAAGVKPERVAAGSELDSGNLRLQVLWPPRDLLVAAVPGEDPNQLALVMEARWRDFTMLLTADAEAESVSLDPGPVDVLKVAHHGSDDAGLGPLLDRIQPQLAVISVGQDNPYGHPTQGTLSTLAEHGVPTLRTDEDGTVVIDVSKGSFRVDG